MYKNNIYIFVITLGLLSACGGGNSSTYTGSSGGDTNSTTKDTIAPVISIKGKNPKYRALGSGYVDEGASAKDKVDGIVEVTMTGTVNTDTVGIYEIIYTAKDKAGNEAKAIRKVIVENITHHGIRYGIVTSPITGKIWLNKNIGAAYPCSKDKYESDNACEGDFFQWGRNIDGHEDSISGTRTKKVSGLQSSDGKFVIGNADWSTSEHRGANWSKTDGSSVCPVGFRVPTIQEFKAELPKEHTTDSLSFLKTPWGRSRTISGQNFDTSSDMAGGRGGMWTTTVTGIVEETYVSKNGESQYIRAAGTYILLGSKLFDFASKEKLRAHGYYVRCIRP